MLDAREGHDAGRDQCHADADERLHGHESLHRIGDTILNPQDPASVLPGKGSHRAGRQFMATREQQVDEDKNERFHDVEAVAKDIVDHDAG